MSEFDAPHTLVAALCYLAASAHSEDASQQQEMAAAFYQDCTNQFAGVAISAKLEALLSDFIKNAGKPK